MSDQYCRPASFEDVVSLVKSLNENKVPYLLIGGYALFAHGYHRATEDIDILIPAGDEVAKKIIKALMVLPDKSAKDLPLDWFEKGEEENIRLADAFVVDLMFNACGETYESLLPYAESFEIAENVILRTINLEGLLLTKQTVREKDIMDRLVIERALQAIKNRNP